MQIRIIKKSVVDLLSGIRKIKKPHSAFMLFKKHSKCGLSVYFVSDNLYDQFSVSTKDGQPMLK